MRLTQWQQRLDETLDETLLLAEVVVINSSRFFQVRKICWFLYHSGNIMTLRSGGGGAGWMISTVSLKWSSIGTVWYFTNKIVKLVTLR